VITPKDLKEVKSPDDFYAEDVFIDSGAWSLFRLNVMKQGKGMERLGKHGRVLEEAPGDLSLADFSYYSLKAGSPFRLYCDDYAKFINRMEGPVKLFANVDVIGNPERTWDVQQYFETEHGLRPIPVIHVDTSMEYVDRYVERGYPLIGFGGFASGIGGWERMRVWCDQAFMRICPKSNNYLPVVKVHGFAMTGMKGIRRWPWYSVDSTSWVIWPANGWIPVPRWTARAGFDFSLNPWVINVCPTSKTKRLRQRHMDNVPATAKENLTRWLKQVGVPWGSVDEKGKMVEWGVLSHHEARTIANLHFFIGLQASIPKWPWPLSESIINQQRVVYRKGFGI